ncbi:MAG: BTAD domain-containing putative transcriptional regulator [Acidimicrobiales bacterium]
MHIGLLGGLEVRTGDGDEIRVSGAKLRALVAMLALDVGQVVPTDRLVDALWGEDPPAAVRNSLQGLVSKLRRVLGSADLVAMRGEGYALELPGGAIDVHRFEQIVAEGRALVAAGDRAGAVALMAEGDLLWRGEALADFTYEDFAVAAIARLTELRLAVIEERLDLELQLGRHQAAIVPLEELVAAHPLRERARGLLMLALYRAGRQADALRAFQDGRHRLGEELGLDPGHELRHLEAAILAQDRSLDAPATEALNPAIRPGARSAIPDALTPLVGRDEELRDLTGLLADCRFITLVGPGGVGKTRLALEVARAEAAELTDGGCLVELAPVGDPAGVRAAIASALDIPDPTRLAELIGDSELLLLLDNCEHVITTAAEVAEDLLRRCPGLRLLVTSREGLRVGGETIWPVPPLRADDAVRLFVARAQAAGASLELSDESRAAISDVCARLDGLPLAIELAAARTRAFPITDIAARLNDRFRLLTGGSRTALPRQQTLRAVVDWSYELLFDDEQRAFERLSVFPGGCDLATAEAVCADDTLAAEDLVDHIHALVDKSLVVARPVGDGVRFTQLQTLAQYGRERLAERGDTVRIRDAMAEHFARLCAESAVAYTGDRQRGWLTAIDQEHDNLRAALDWAVANDDATTALTIAGGASWPHWLAGTLVEGKRWLDDAFSCGGDADERARALALTGRGLLDFLAGQPEHSDEDLEAAIEVFERHGDRQSMVLAYSFYAEQALVRGDLDEARRRRLGLFATYEGWPDHVFGQAARSFSLAKLAVVDGDLGEAERHYRAATDGFGQLDRPVMSSMCLGMVADFDERAGDFPAAIRALEEAIETNASLLGGFTGALLAHLGWVLLLDGQVARAEAAYHQALDSARRVRHAMVLFQALTGLAALHRLHQRDDEAVEAATEALEHYRGGGFRRFRNRVHPETDLLSTAAVGCGVLAAIAADRGEPERAAHLLGEADRFRADAGVGIPGFQQADLAAARATAEGELGPAPFAKAYEAGRRAP